MKCYLLVFDEDYADEHDVPALACMTEEEYDKWLETPSGKLNPNYGEELAKYLQDQALPYTERKINSWDRPKKVRSRMHAYLGNGGDYNEKGFKVLDPHVRIIQGDGIDAAMIEAILHMLETKKFSAENIVFGSGGGLLQKFDRDTQKFAIKASYGERATKDKTFESFDIQKDPITSSGKKSKKGLLKLHKAGNAFMTFSSAELTAPQFAGYHDVLETVFENGELKKEYTIDEIRHTSNQY